jgi:hypothetical protein
MEAADETVKKKHPSRKQRRKPSSLRESYSRRQRTCEWLETHIWHAKRMKMVGRYGFRVAEHCSDKGVRAAHRSLVNGCLMSVSFTKGLNVAHVDVYVTVVGYFLLLLQRGRGRAGCCSGESRCLV